MYMHPKGSFPMLILLNQINIDKEKSITNIHLINIIMIQYKSVI